MISFFEKNMSQGSGWGKSPEDSRQRVAQGRVLLERGNLGNGEKMHKMIDLFRGQHVAFVDKDGFLLGEGYLGEREKGRMDASVTDDLEGEGRRTWIAIGDVFTVQSATPPEEDDASSSYGRDPGDEHVGDSWWD